MINWLKAQQKVFGVILLFMALTVIISWPVPLHLDEIIVGDDNDVPINPWADWWSAKAWSDPAISLWETDYLFYPEGVDLHYHSFSHINTLFALGLTPFWGALPAYNITMLLNFVLIGLSMFQLAQYVTQSDKAALLAALVFTFNSQTVYQIAHPVLFCTWSLAWMTLYLLRGLHEKQPKYMVLSALFVFLGTSSSILLLILMICLVLFFLMYLLVTKQIGLDSWRLLAIFAGLSGGSTFLLLWPQLRNAFVANDSSFVIDIAGSINTDMFSIFVPHWYAWFTRSMYLGIVPLFLALLVWGHKRQQAKKWLLLVAVAYLFAIGPYPRLFIWHFDNIPLFWTFPLAPVLRNMYRMMLLFVLGWSLVIGFGWLALADQIAWQGRKQWALFVVVFALIWVDYTAVPFPARPANLSLFYTEYLQDVPDDVALAVLPTGRQEDKRYMFYQTVHQHPITGGVTSRPDADVFQLIESNALLRAGAVDLEPKPIPADLTVSLQELAHYQIGYIVFEKQFLEAEQLTDWRTAFLTDPVFEDEWVLVYSVVP